MRPVLRTWVTGALSLAGFVAGLSWTSDVLPQSAGEVFSTAHAVIGRPASPVSYAGVARRTTRRVVYVGAATRPYYPPPPPPPPSTTTVIVVPAPPPTCVQVVDQYGNVSYRCP